MPVKAHGQRQRALLSWSFGRAAPTPAATALLSGRRLSWEEAVGSRLVGLQRGCWEVTRKFMMHGRDDPPGFKPSSALRKARA